MGDVFDERSERASGNEELLSVTISNGVIRQIDSEKRNIASEDKSNYKVVKKGDVPYNSMRMWQGAVGTSDYDGIVSPAYTVLIPKNNCNGKFFMELFKKQPTLEIFKRWSQGLTSDTWNLKYPVLSTIPFMVPSVKEQEKIAEYFKSLDNLITLHQRKLFEAKNNPKNGSKNFFRKIYQKLYKFDFNFKTYDWEQRKFTSVFEGLQNNTLSRAELNYENGTVKNVHYGDVLIKFGDYIDASKTELPYISDNAKVEKFKNSFLQDGDIIIADTAEDGTVGKCTEIQGSEGVQLLSGLHTIACRPKEKYGPMFLGYYINSSAYHSKLKPLMQGIKVTSISKSAFQDTNMIMPTSIEEQSKIGAYFANLDRLITLHQREVFYTLKHIFYRCCDTLLSGGLKNG